MRSKFGVSGAKRQWRAAIDIARTLTGFVPNFRFGPVHIEQTALHCSIGDEDFGCRCFCCCCCDLIALQMTGDMRKLKDSTKRALVQDAFNQEMFLSKNFKHRATAEGGSIQ